MIETLPDEAVYVAGAAFVAALVIVRLYVGEHYFNDQARFWQPLRRVVIPLLHRVLKRVNEDGELYAETEIDRDELVAIIDDPPEAVLEQLAAAGYEPQPLASFARDWEGRPEIASWARYDGPAPFHGAPHFFRPRQVHVRLFAAEGEPDMIPVIGELETIERTIITAHEEATPWRPDLWRDHYGGQSVDVETGRVLAAYDLGLNEELAIDVDDVIHEP